MISWIKGEVISLWQTNNKFFILINCNGLGYEIQILESIFLKIKSNEISHHNFILWIKHIKKEESDSFFGFESKDQKDFFNKILNIKGIGSQIGMSLLNKFSINEIINAINTKDKKLLGSIQGIGQKMTERIILELKVSVNQNNQNENDNFITLNKKFSSILQDIDLTLQSLNYSKKEIKNLIPTLIKDINSGKIQKGCQGEVTFENLLKQAMVYLDSKNSNIGQ